MDDREHARAIGRASRPFSRSGGHPVPEWHQWTATQDATLLLAVIALAILCLAAGCLPVAQLRRDAIARGVIDADIGARAKLTRAELGGMALSSPDLAPSLLPVQESLRRIEELAETGVHRAQTAQVLWAADPAKIRVTISLPSCRNAEDDRAVVEMAGTALGASNRRWWKHVPKWLSDGVTAFSATVARAIVVEVPKAIIPWWLWPPIVAVLLFALTVLCRFYWLRYVTMPAIARAKAEAERQHAEAIARKDRALDEYDGGIEQLPPRIREFVGHGRPALAMEHAPRNEKRKAETRAFIQGLLPDDPNADAMTRIAEENDRLRSEKAAAVKRSKTLDEIIAVLDGMPTPPDPSACPPADPQKTEQQLP